MPSWDCLIDEASVASVIPDEYDRFRRPVRDALTAFLDGLPATHQAAVLAEQASLPPTASASERLTLLARSCPALHKLGQTLARDQRLSAELRRHLQELESLPPSVPLEAIQRILAREFSRLERLGVELVPPALAEASVAVVIPFRRSRGVRGVKPQEGVFKILKPGIDERLEQELELFARVGSYLDQRCDDLRIPHLDYRESFEQVRDKLRHELRLDLEQRHLARARAVYEGEPRVQIPGLFDLCTPRVTAMERVTGGKVTEHSLAPPDEKRRLADLVVEALIARPFFAPAGAALFHGDPHAGNLFLTRDHRLAILDWSLTGSLGERERRAVVQTALGAISLDADRIVTALAGLDERRRVDRPALESVVHTWLRRVRRGQLPGFTWLMGLLDEATRAARLRVGVDLLLFRKSLHTLEGVVADIGAGGGRIDDVFLREFLRHLVVEWPRRWLAPPHSRAFATRLSNADLAQLTLTFPWTAAQFWLDQTLDLMSHDRRATGADGSGYY
jgi:ubiquinone biosynthesis protein